MARHPHLEIRKIVLFILPAIFFISLCFTPTANAEPNLHAGNLEFHPYFTLLERHSSNVYSTATERKNDYITTAIPGLKLELPINSKHRLGVDYNAVLDRYGKYTEENTSDHNASVSGEMNLASVFMIKLSDDYKKGHEGRGASSTGFIEKFWTNSAGVTLEYSLTDLSKVRFDASYDKWNFTTSKFRNRHDQDNSLYVYYRILPKTSVFGEYDHKRTTYELKSPDLASKTDGGQLGLIWEISERSKGTVKTGYLKKNFNDKSLKDRGSWIYSVDLSHDFSSKTSVKLNGQRTVNEASLSGTNYLQTTGGRVEFFQRVYDKFAASLNGSYNVDKFSNAVVSISPLVRRDVSVATGAALKYMMRDWLDFSVGYTHRTRNSNINDNDYDVNEYMLQINAAM